MPEKLVENGRQVPILRALISVYDKNGIDDLARGLHEAGVAIVSTGNTAARLAAAGIPVTKVEDLTGFPECLDGRVKTLHPRVHAGLLADMRLDDHRAQLAELGVEPFTLVISNLYPFAETVASGAQPGDVIEQIDIGGPSMVRAAAKNHANVAIIVNPARYPEVLRAVRDGGFTLAERQALAAEAFRHTATYDVHVASWMGNVLSPPDDGTVLDPPPAPLNPPPTPLNPPPTPLSPPPAPLSPPPTVLNPPPARFPTWLGGTWERSAVLRYGENPHQPAALYRAGHSDPGVAGAEQLHGKEMSYNNYVDADAAWRAAHDFSEPAVAIIKHTNPCGIAVGAEIAEAHRKAHATDPVSAFGGVIAANRPVSTAMAEQITDVFTEVVAAPDFEQSAIDILTRKKNVRLLRVATGPRGAVETRPISGGLLMQVADRIDAAGDDASSWTLAAGDAADDDTVADLEFAWRAVRSVKSNAILLAKGRAAVGVGMGQVNRVDSARLAVSRAADRAAGSVAASDAFFPFADGLQVLLDGGVRAVVQPGGSVRDDEVVEAAERAGVTMYLTGTRHFFH